MTFLELLEKPLWYASLTVFLVGVIWRLISLFLSGRSLMEPAPAGSAFAGAIQGVLGQLLPRRTFLGRGKVWFVTVAGYAFHIGLFAVLLFAAPHVAFIEQRLTGFGWTPLPRWGFIVAAQLGFAGLAVLWIRRFVDPVTRLISRRDDHAAAGLTFLAMLTGCLALGEQSEALRAIHLASVEAWLVYFPFSSLMHTFVWPLSRGYSGAFAGRRGVKL